MTVTAADALALVEARRNERGLSRRQLAERLGVPPVWLAAALHGEHPFAPGAIAPLAGELGLEPAALAVLTEPVKRRGHGSPVPVDPTIYRFHEVVLLYGEAIKDLIHEEFGDGIMSAINFSIDVERDPHPDGDRVRVTMSGKFLPYQWVA
ncbi:MAG TPA: cyanase [Solirubrobacteraceae bacterium]|jgi:cyanate lyase|nr:cyanase [Solirubrobacteraceae bacterium]